MDLSLHPLLHFSHFLTRSFHHFEIFFWHPLSHVATCHSLGYLTKPQQIRSKNFRRHVLRFQSHVARFRRHVARLHRYVARFHRYVARFRHPNRSQLSSAAMSHLLLIQLMQEFWQSGKNGKLDFFLNFFPIEICLKCKKAGTNTTPNRPTLR